MGEPAVRLAVAGAMQRMGEAFVLGRSIEEALKRADRGVNRSFRYSFDMLGEAAKTADDATAYFEAYAEAVAALGEANDHATDIFAVDSISVKLSALHPRYEPLQSGRAVPELAGRLIDLARAAREAGVGLTVDAEESERLDMSLDIIEAAARDPVLAGWDGLGMAVQSYQRRAEAVIEWAAALGEATGRRLMVRLVKGAYWDSEIKRAQELGLTDYPVFTRKTATDVSYLACARMMLARAPVYPAFATHNALTVATVLEWAGDRSRFEFQRLHGMGEGLYEPLMVERGLAVRVYAPVGGYRELLAYLVRRLLENGANSSFVHQIADRSVSDEELLADPVAEVERVHFATAPSDRGAGGNVRAPAAQLRGFGPLGRRHGGRVDSRHGEHSRPAGARRPDCWRRRGERDRPHGSQSRRHLAPRRRGRRGPGRRYRPRPGSGGGCGGGLESHRP